MMLHSEILNMDHRRMVTALVKPPYDILNSLTDIKVDLMHMTFGICGEAGELLDGIKKYIIYENELDLQNIIEELGDLEFYMEGLRQRLSITRDETLAHNMFKLSERYDKFKYSNQAAIDRVDKV